MRSIYHHMQLGIAALAISSALVSCKVSDAVEKQQANQKIVELQYQLVNSDNLDEKLKSAYAIIDIDYENMGANEFLLATFNTSKDIEVRQSIAKKFLEVAYNNLDKYHVLVSTLNLMELSEISSIELDQLLREYFAFNLAKNNINADFVRKNLHNFSQFFSRDLAFGNFDLFMDVESKFSENLDDLSVHLINYYNLYCFDAYDTISRFTQNSSSLNISKTEKIAKEKRKFYLDNVLKKRKDYLILNADLLIETVAKAKEYELALDMADDFKNLNGFNEQARYLVRANAFANIGNYKKALDFAKEYPEDNETTLIQWAINCDDLEYAEEIAKKLHEEKKLFLTTILYLDILVKLEKFDEAEQFVADNGNSKLLNLIFSMSKELQLYKFTQKTTSEIEKVIADSKEFSQYSPPEQFMFVFTALEYLGGTKNGVAILDLYELYKDNYLMPNSTGYALLEADYNLSKAHELIEIAFNREPTDISTIDSYAWSLYKQGKFIEAKKIIDLLLTMNLSGVYSSLGAIYLHAGDIYRANNLEEQAIKFYHRAANYPENGLFRYSELKNRLKK